MNKFCDGSDSSFLSFSSLFSMSHCKVLNKHSNMYYLTQKLMGIMLI